MKQTVLVIVAGLLLGLTLGGCPSSEEPRAHAPPAPSTQQTLAGRAVLIVVAPENFRDEEFSEPEQILTKAGAKLTVASLRAGICTGAGGLTVRAELTPDQVTVADYGAVIFVGGPGMIQYLDNQKLIDLAKRFHEADKVTAAICVAPVILANAGLLEGKSATVWADKQAALEAKGAEYSDAPVVVTGNVITANGPLAAEKFGQAIVDALQ